MRWSGLTGRRGYSRPCPTCRGQGTIDEHDADLHSAGIVTWGTTVEDFRSFPTHSR